jgi:hypothetical protein
LNPDRGKRCFCSEGPDWRWDPPVLQFSRYRSSVPDVKRPGREFEGKNKWSCTPPMCVPTLVQEHLYPFFVFCFPSRWEGGTGVCPFFYQSTHVFLLRIYSVIFVNVKDMVLYKWGTGCFPGLKRPGLGVDHPPHQAPKVKKE